MANETPLTLVGNMVGDPELRFTASGAQVANFTVATTPRKFNKNTNEWEDGEALFMRCAIWREAAEQVAQSLTKGMRVVVVGHLEGTSWEDKDSGQKRTGTQMNVLDVGPSLKYATAQVTKVQRQQGQQQGGQQPQGGGGWGGAPQGQQPPAQGGWGQQPQQQGPPPQQHGGGGWSQQGQQSAPPQQQGQWGSAPSYDEPPF